MWMNTLHLHSQLHGRLNQMFQRIPLQFQLEHNCKILDDVMFIHVQCQGRSLVVSCCPETPLGSWRQKFGVHSSLTTIQNHPYKLVSKVNITKSISSVTCMFPWSLQWEQAVLSADSPQGLEDDGEGMHGLIPCGEQGGCVAYHQPRIDGGLRGTSA